MKFEKCEYEYDKVYKVNLIIRESMINQFYEIAHEKKENIIILKSVDFVDYESVIHRVGNIYIKCIVYDYKTIIEIIYGLDKSMEVENLKNVYSYPLIKRVSLMPFRTFMNYLRAKKAYKGWLSDKF